MARFLIIAGIIFIILGVLLIFFPKIGHLPGDIYIEKPHSRIIIPITSMVIISVILTVVINLVLWIISKIR
jgi:uncharacterized protein HemY